MFGMHFPISGGVFVMKSPNPLRTFVESLGRLIVLSSPDEPVRHATASEALAADWKRLGDDFRRIGVGPGSQR